MWWDQKLDFVEEGGSRNLGFLLNARGGDGAGRFGRRQGMEDHHSRLRWQMAEKMGLRVEAPPPLPFPEGNKIPWHHRAGPIGGGLHVMSSEERAADTAAIRAAMPHILTPVKAFPLC